MEIEQKIDSTDYKYSPIDIDYYRDQFKDISVNVYEVDIVRSNSENERDYNITFQDFGDFFSYVENENIKSIFFNELFIDLNIFFIGDNLLQDVPEKIKEYLKNDISKINENSAELVDKINNTHILEMRCVNQGQVLYYRVVDDNIALSATGEELLGHLIDSIPSEIKNNLIRETEEDNKRELKALEDFILNDSEFHASTNLNLRREYLTSLKEKYPTYQGILNANGIKPIASMTFIDKLWKAHIYSSNK